MRWLQLSVNYLRDHDVIVHDGNGYGSNAIHCGAERELALTVLDDVRIFQLARSNPPGRNDLPPEFSVTYSTLDEALLAVRHYFHGQPVKIDGWSIPRHQRPHWSLSKLQFCIATARHLSGEKFAAHVAHLRKTAPYPYQGMTHEADKHSQYRDRIDFEEYAHHDDAQMKLMLRKDLEEGYIVRFNAAA